MRPDVSLERVMERAPQGVWRIQYGPNVRYAIDPPGIMLDIYRGEKLTPKQIVQRLAEALMECPDCAHWWSPHLRVPACERCGRIPPDDPVWIDTEPQLRSLFIIEKEK